jgi:predicted transcriptional regulator
MKPGDESCYWEILPRILGSDYKCRILQVFEGMDSTLAAKEIQKRVKMPSVGTFFHHLCDLEFFSVVYHGDNNYTLTEFGKKILDTYKTLHQKMQEMEKQEKN